MSSWRQQVTGNINSFNSLTNYNIVNIATGPEAERHQILQWLSPLEPEKRHQGVRTDRLDGVGNWVLETSELRKWRDAEDGCVEPALFCYGNPGVGKTYISSLVIDSLCDRASGKNMAVVGLYCDFLAQQEQSTTSMLGAVLKQLVGRGGVPGPIWEAFQNSEEECCGRGLRIPDMVEILKKIITSLQRIFICIDALDELAPKHRRELLESLQEIARTSSNMRILLTGRPHIDDEIVEFFSKAVKIPISPTQDDIRSYLGMKLKGDTTPRAMDDRLRADIMRIIPEKVSEIFLLVSLNIDAVLAEITLHQRRRRLHEMAKGEGLGDAYAATLSRMKAQPRSRSKLGMEVLMWISHSERSLHVDELCHALGVEEGSVDLNVQNIPAVETILACTLGLVTIEKSSSTIRPVHYTLQEYLSHNPNLFIKPHSRIAKICLTYLNFRQVRGIPTVVRSPPATTPFVEYASCYWGIHAKRETTESVKALALKLLDGYDRHISSKMLLLSDFRTPDWERPFDWEGRPIGFTGLHGAAYLGCVEITVALLEMKRWDVEARDLRGNTALAWAARRGQEGVARILLELNGANPNTPNVYGRTPLSQAAQNGSEEVVKILLKRNEVNPNIPDRDGRTPLSWAAEDGNEGIIRILLERNGINPNTPDKGGRTPLSLAAEDGHEGVVRVLLERSDADPSISDKNHRAPLSWAAGDGHEGVVRILLERSDVNPSIGDLSGRTPLSWAAKNGHDGTVRILLERKFQNDVNPNLLGQSLLQWAAGGGYEVVVRILLERYDVNPSTPNEFGQTPLLSAAAGGNEGVMRILLERNDINPNTPGRDGRTPLSRAVENGHEGAVRMLLEQNNINPNIPDKRGRTSLSWATHYWREGIARMLREWDEANSNKASDR